MDNASLKNFEKFVEKEITPAVKELKMLEDQSRIHVQRLVFANLVDRFDTMIDLSILENFREKHLVDKVVKKLTDPTIKSELLLLSRDSNLKGPTISKVKDELRNHVLRKRHSKKLKTLFTVFRPDVECFSVPRVNESNGAIYIKKGKPKTTKYSICGYADLLYSKRNSIVHGGGEKKLLPNDIKRLEKQFGITEVLVVEIQVSSIWKTINFYNGVVDILMERKARRIFSLYPQRN